MSDSNTVSDLNSANIELKGQIILLEEALLDKERVVEMLRDSRMSYQRLFDSTQEGILILDAGTGRIIDVNPWLVKLTGCSYNELHGKHLWELTVFKGIAESRDGFEAVKNNGSIRYSELQLVTITGKIIFAEFVSCEYLMNHVKVIQCTFHDITEKLKLSANLQQAQKMDSIGLLVGGVAHDYNNMLTVILGYAEMALRKVNQTQPVYTDIEEIIKAVMHSMGITRQLLTFVRKQTIIPEILDLNLKVKNLLRILRQITGKDIDLAWQPGADLCRIKMDSVQVDLILVNLCVNARDAIKESGSITIATGNAVFDDTYCALHSGVATGEYVLLEVSDDGCGMDKETLSQIFEPFFTSKEKGQGTGLGLSTVQGIIRRNNGFINASSAPGKGTTFSIYLPRHPD